MAMETYLLNEKESWNEEGMIAKTWSPKIEKSYR